MSTYATELTTIKRLALQTLYQILQTATDPAELRRTATAILRIPDPKQNPRGNAGATEAAPQPSTPEPPQTRATGCRGSARQPVPSTPDLRIAQDAPPESAITSDPAFTHNPNPAPEPEGLIVSNRGVERGSASDTPGSPRAIQSHPDRVLVAPGPAPPPRASSG